MKKITLFMLAFSVAIICFSQKPFGKTTTSSAFTSKAPMSANVHDLKSSSPSGKVFWAPTSGSKVSYMTQNFDGTFLPTGWTQTILFTTKTWMQGNPLNNPFTAIDPTNVSSSICPYSLPGETQNEWLKSPSITGTATATSLFLKFWAGFSYDYLPAGGLGAPGATLQCKISTDGGTNWTTLWDANNTPLFTGWVWREISLDITSYKANPFMLAWVVSGADGDLMALDNVSISEPSALNGGVTEIKAPLSSCSNLSASENIIVKIENFGTTTITGFPVSYILNNNTPVTATFSGSILPGDTALYTFTGANAANLSASGNYQITAYTSIVGDADIANDSSTNYIYSGAAAIPFSMGFEDTEDLSGWSVTDVNADGFDWGIYTGAQYAHSGSGFAAYPYNTDGLTAANDWLFTKCMYLIAGNAYQLKFYYRALVNIYPEAMNVNIGQTNTPLGMVTQLVDLPNISDTTYPSSTTFFAVPLSGTYYIGFHCKSVADMAYLLLDDITVDLVTNITENEDRDLNIYPNPANNMVTISSPENITHLKVLDLLGNIVYEEDTYQSMIQLNTSTYSKGIYFMVVNTEKQKFTRKLQIIK